MPMHVVIMPNEELSTGDEIGVFDGEVCIGATVNDGIAENPVIIIISMDDLETEIIDGAIIGNNFTLSVWKNNSGSVIENIQYSVMEGESFLNGLGTSIIHTEALTVNLSDTDRCYDTFFNITPNPFHNSTNFSINMPFDGSVKIEIFNMTGLQLNYSFTETLSKGYHRIACPELPMNSGAFLVKALFQQPDREVQLFKKIIKN